MAFLANRRTAVIVVTVGAAFALAWRLRMHRPRKAAIVVVEAPCGEDAKFYADLCRVELSDLSVDVTERTSSRRPSHVSFLLIWEGSTVELVNLPLPDPRVYRTVPQLVGRMVVYHIGPAMKEELIAQEVHDACFHSVMNVPQSVSLTQREGGSHRVPRAVLSCSAPRVVAECYLCDVVEAKHDLLISTARVADDVCARAVEHHGDWRRFVAAVESQFGIPAPNFADESEVPDFLIAHRHLFSSAMLSNSGANNLELVFGVSSVHFPLLHCASESVTFLSELYLAAVHAFGNWTFENFSAFVHAVFGHDRPEVVRHVPRIFRTLNKSRTGEISFEELCGWVARKLSTRTIRHPDQHLLATINSLRLPYVFFMDKRSLWPKLECVLRSLSDDDVHI